MTTLHVSVSRLDGVVVDYAVTVLVDGAGVSTEQLDYLTLQSNRVENSYREVVERATVVHTISEVKNFITEALENNELESGKTMLPTRDSLKIFPEHTCCIYSSLCNWHGGGVTGNALAEALRGKHPNVTSNRDTVDPALILQHTLHHLRKHSRVLMVSSVSYSSALSVRVLRSFSSKVGHFE